MNYHTKPIKPITKAEAQAKGIYYKIPKNYDIQTLFSDFGYKLVGAVEFVYVETLNGQEVIVRLETNRKNTEIHNESYGIYDPKTGLPMHPDVRLQDVVWSMVNPYRTMHVFTTPTTTVFIDLHNLNFYISIAKDYQKKYGTKRIEHMPVTGQEYYDKIMQMYQVADEMDDRKILTDLFNYLPLEKDGSFQNNRKTVILDNDLVIWDKYLKSFGLCHKLTLSVVPSNTFEYYDHYDVIRPIDPYTARLAITVTPNTAEYTPLISR